MAHDAKAWRKIRAAAAAREKEPETPEIVQLKRAGKAALDLLESEGRDTGLGGPLSELRDAVERTEPKPAVAASARLDGQTQSEAKHTPGPWAIQKPPNIPNADRLNAVIETHGRFPLALVYAGLAKDIGNARLIAAAPDLLAACKLVRHWIEQMRGVGRELPGMDARFAELTAVVARAEGKGVK